MGTQTISYIFQYSILARIPINQCHTRFPTAISLFGTSERVAILILFFVCRELLIASL